MKKLIQLVLKINMKKVDSTSTGNKVTSEYGGEFYQKNQNQKTLNLYFLIYLFNKFDRFL